MKSGHRLLLAVDAVVNLVMGLTLLLFPAGTQRLLGLPSTNTFFYATILGGVILGIGAALCLEWWGALRGVRGLGLGGAIAINLCGSAGLLFWLVSGRLALPPRGRVMLWIVALAVLGIGVAEVASGTWRHD
jgi:hypothetical protein